MKTDISTHTHTHKVREKETERKSFTLKYSSWVKRDKEFRNDEEYDNSSKQTCFESVENRNLLRASGRERERQRQRQTV